MGARRRAATGTLEACSASALPLIALRILDDNFLQPAAGHLPDRPPRQRPRPARPAGARRLGVSAARRRPAGRAGARCSASLGLATGVDAVHYTRELGLGSRRRQRLRSRSPPALALLGLGATTLWRTRSHDGHRAWRYAAPRCCSRRCVLVAVDDRRCCRSASPTSSTHVARAVVPADQLGTPHETVTFKTKRRPEARGLVHPVAQRRRGDLVPGPQGPAAPGAHARPPRLRRAAVRPPRRGPQRGRAEHLRLGRRRGHQGRDRAT